MHKSQERGGRLAVDRSTISRLCIASAIEHLKSHRWGFGLRYALSARPKRLDILLLLGTLVSLVAWLTGLVARNLPTRPAGYCEPLCRAVFPRVGLDCHGFVFFEDPNRKRLRSVET